MKKTLIFAAAITALLASAILPNNEPQYLEVTTYWNAMGAKQFARMTDGSNSVDLEEGGRKIDFYGSRAKLCNFMHQKGYTYVDERPGMASGELTYLFRLD